eukprot:15479448-Alexandrium_andersonii.AAC.1
MSSIQRTTRKGALEFGECLGRNHSAAVVMVMGRFGRRHRQAASVGRGGGPRWWVAVVGRGGGPR